MPMLHVDMSYSAFHTALYTLDVPEVQGLPLQSCYSDRELQPLTFYSFSLLFNGLDSSSTSLLCY